MTHAASTMRRRLRPIGFMDSAAAIRFTKYPTVAPQDAIVSFPTFMRLANLKSIEDITIRSILVKLKEGVTSEQKDEVKQALEKAVSEVDENSVHFLEETTRK